MSVAPSSEKIFLTQILEMFKIKNEKIHNNSRTINGSTSLIYKYEFLGNVLSQESSDEDS